MIPPLTAEITPRQTAQLVINGVHQGAAGRLRAVAPGEQQASDIRIQGHQSWVRSRILCRDAPGDETVRRAIPRISTGPAIRAGPDRRHQRSVVMAEQEPRTIRKIRSITLLLAAAAVMA